MEPRVDSSKADAVDLTVTCEQCGSVLGSDDIFCGECGYVTRAASRNFSRPRDTAIIQAAQVEREALEAAASIVHSDKPAAHAPQQGLGESGDQLQSVKATPIVAPRSAGARFVLQFSTGESFTVYGSGLVGRNPRPEPAEYFDHVVRVLDPSRSVSKTHLEFGQEAGAFWIKDRFSGNGSIIREPEGDRVRCEPDRRYRVVRGTRVDIGEQFFVIS
ncbi:MAG: zinc ribbon domain-containing protein [Lacisediminihabitans sp.]